MHIGEVTYHDVIVAAPDGADAAPHATRGTSTWVISRLYRDLKPENILMAASGHLQIADFGIAIENIFGDQTATEYAGTPGYIAPEFALVVKSALLLLGVN
ncbi:calcium-dependent protein kinase C-like [Pseudophryne corroboree]|uniref:calcium-dependent protein kinase C-like n=1 Tax=Pseudophryne corroboree TaxID=495146 RepID=UPI0030818F92